MLAAGFAMCFRQVPARQAVETSNAFASLMPEYPIVLDLGDEGHDQAVNSESDVPDPRVSLTVGFSAPSKCCGPATKQCRNSLGRLWSKLVSTRRR